MSLRSVKEKVSPTKPNNNGKVNDNNSNNIVLKLYNFVVYLLNDSKYFGWLALLLLLADVAINCGVVLRVAYTEIDWSTYMQQITLFVNGERDYTKLEGDTGPVVYPAGFIYVYALLRQLTDLGQDIRRAQWIFAGISAATTATVLAIYGRDKQHVPNFVLVLLILSKRIHSIFVLRLFNDCIAMLSFYVALYLFTRHRWSLGCAFFSAAVSVKMNVLLYAPGLLLLLLQTYGLVYTVPRLAICGLLQVAVAIPFLAHHPVSYLVRAFEFSRQFMYKWTVNWRFVPVDVFLSKPWAIGLLACHLTLLAIFIFKWMAKSKRASNLTLQVVQNKPRQLSPNYILTVMFTCNLIGITFARSLHYQFYVWYYHSLPYLLWQQTVLPVPIRILILATIEYSWNQYPSTDLSSIFLFICNFLIVTSLLFSESPAPLAQPNPTQQKKKQK